MIHPLPDPPFGGSPQIRWALRITATFFAGFSAGAITLAKCHDFLPGFMAGAGAVLTLFWAMALAPESLNCESTGNWLQPRYSAWRMTRRGILLFNKAPGRAALFLPWSSLREAQPASTGIILKSADKLTAFTLALHTSANKEHIINELNQHFRSDYPHPDEMGGAAVFIVPAPFPLFRKKQLLPSIPWVLAGIAFPQYPSESTHLFSAICLAAAAAFAGLAFSHEGDQYEAGCYLGYEIRRTLQGIHIRCAEGWHYFQPWSEIQECIRIGEDQGYLNFGNKPTGLSICRINSNFPLNITRSHRVLGKWTHLFLNSLLILLCALIGYLWACLF